MSPEEHHSDDPPEVVLPAVARRILVPVANPATAEALLRLALSLIDEHGQVIAAYVIPASTEPRTEVIDKLEGLIGVLGADGSPIKLVTDLATSIPRGILDLAQERAADLIVLGIRGQQGDRVVLGPVVDAVARTAPCDVLVYRGLKPLYLGSGYNDVIVPVDGSRNSQLAARIGLRFAAHTRAPLSALYVQTAPNLKRAEVMPLMDASLSVLPAAIPVEIRKLVVHDADVVHGILSRVQPDDLLVLGFSEDSSLDTWLFKEISQRLLSEAPGPLLLVKQSESPSVARKIQNRLSNLLPTLTPSEEAEVVQVANDMVRPSANFFVLVVLSCLIASLALLQDNVAVVIGAMLIAPLMSPLMGFAVGLIEGRPALMRTGSLTLTRGMLMALALAFVVGFLAPNHTPTNEMLSRGRPSLLDLGIALFSGMAGAYAMARKDIPSALAGTAIAAALMPPLCTMGLALAFGLIPLASGATLLFVTNIVAISLGGGLVFWWLGLRLRAHLDSPERYRWRVLTSLAVLVALSAPLAATFVGTIREAEQLDTIQAALAQALSGEVIDVQLGETTLPSGASALSVVATMRLPDVPTPADVSAAEAQVSQRIGRSVSLELVAWQTVRPPGQ